MNALNSITFGSKEVAVRINSVASGDLATEDIQAFLHGPVIPTTLLVPKVEYAYHLEWVSVRYAI